MRIVTKAVIFLLTVATVFATSTSTDVRFEYDGNGSTTVFSVPHYFETNADLKVYLVEDTHYTETLQTLTTHYTVSGAGASAGGSVTMLTAPTSTQTLVIIVDHDPTQDLDLLPNGAIDVAALETQLDLLAAQIQYLKDRSSRSMRLPEGIHAETLSIDTTIPTPTAGKTIIWNSTADGFAEGPSGDDVEAAAANATAAAASATAAAASATSASSAVAATLGNTVEYKTNADSPVAITDSDRGKIFELDTTSGDIEVNLPEISTLTMGSGGWMVGFKKTDSSGNNGVINGGGSDQIDDTITVTLTTEDEGVWIIPEDSPSPDSWTSMQFGTQSTIADNSVTLAKLDHGTQGDVLYYAASGAPTRLGAGTSGQFLKTLGAGANPAWADVPVLNSIDETHLAHKTAGDLLYYGGSGVPSVLGIGSTGQVLTVSGGAPAWASGASILVQTANATSSAAATSSNNIPFDTSTPQWTEGYAILQATITPNSTSNIIDVNATVHISSASTGPALTVALFRDGTGLPTLANALASASVPAYAGLIQTVHLSHSTTAANTASTNYYIRVGASSGTIYINQSSSLVTLGGSLISSITVDEKTP